jgi:dolichol-phosphate mannosyltransferase
MVVALFMGAIQLISLGIIGEYIRLIFLETKNRPSYIIKDHKRRTRVASDRPRSYGGRDLAAPQAFGPFWDAP